MADIMQVETVAELRRHVLHAVQSQVNVLLLGSPGVGKTAFINHLATDLGIQCHTTIGAMCDPTDINGFPTRGAVVRDSRGNEIPTVEFAPRKFLVNLADKGGFWFLDEITGAMPATASALLRTIQDKVAGEFALDPYKVAIIAAANPADVAVNGQLLGAPMSNRFCILGYPEGPRARQEWCRNVVSYWGRPPKIGFGKFVLDERLFLKARSWVSGFLGRQPGLWLQLPDTEAGREQPWPSPRAWTAVAAVIARVLQDGLDQYEAVPLAAGLVGSGAAIQLSAFLKYKDLPDPEEMLAKPESYKPTGKGDVDDAALRGVTEAFIAQPTEERLLAFATILYDRACTGTSTMSLEPLMSSYDRIKAQMWAWQSVKELGNKPMFSAEAIRKYERIADPFVKRIVESKETIVRLEKEFREKHQQQQTEDKSTKKKGK